MVSEWGHQAKVCRGGHKPPRSMKAEGRRQVAQRPAGRQGPGAEPLAEESTSLVVRLASSNHRRRKKHLLSNDPSIVTAT